MEVNNPLQLLKIIVIVQNCALTVGVTSSSFLSMISASTHTHIQEALIGERRGNQYMSFLLSLSLRVQEERQINCFTSVFAFERKRECTPPSSVFSRWTEPEMSPLSVRTQSTFLHLPDTQTIFLSRRARRRDVNSERSSVPNELSNAAVEFAVEPRVPGHWKHNWRSRRLFVLWTIWHPLLVARHTPACISLNDFNFTK